jgi:hypothetical protein
MEKKNRHSWKRVEGSKKLKHAQCIHCKLEKWWDAYFGRLMYYDVYGKMFYKTPSCTHVTPHPLPNKPIVPDELTLKFE